MNSDIRPFLPEELPEAFDRLASDEKFRGVIQTIMPEIPYQQFVMLMKSCRTNQEFQQRCVYPFVDKIVKTASDGLTCDFSALDFRQGYTFITNHRDIVLDSAFLCYKLIDAGQDTVEIAIGDNLLIHPWIKDLVRVNRSFIVQRALTMRQMLMASKTMSEYIHYVIQGKRSNVWIAQREGRAKDSDDRTQDSVLKMLALGYSASSNIIDALKDLNIVPLTISYEYDPCDYLKAEEFQHKRDNVDFKKSQQDDLDNMKTGILGRKGRILYHAAPCIYDWLDSLDPSTPKVELFDLVAKHIDREIHRNYRIYPINENAAKGIADSYIEQQLGKMTIDHPDWDFLRERILTMYANPYRNFIAASQQ